MIIFGKLLILFPLLIGGAMALHAAFPDPISVPLAMVWGCLSTAFVFRDGV